MKSGKSVVVMARCIKKNKTKISIIINLDKMADNKIALVEKTIDAVVNEWEDRKWGESLKFSPLICNMCGLNSPEMKVKILVPGTSLDVTWIVCRYCAKEMMLK